MPPPPTEVRRLRPSFAGMIGLACLLFLDLAMIRVFGTTLTLALVALWLLLFLVGCRQFMRRPWVVLAAPVVGFAVWVVVVVARS